MRMNIDKTYETVKSMEMVIGKNVITLKGVKKCEYRDN